MSHGLDALVVRSRSFMVEEHSVHFDANLDLIEYLASCRQMLLRSAEVVRSL